MIPPSNKKILMNVSTVIFIVTTVMLYIFYSGYRLNMTASFPLGVYQVDNDKTVHRGDMILFCPPITNIFLEGLKRGYILHGICPGNMSPLQKKIVAIPGDEIQVTNGVFINGKLQQKSDVHVFDSFGNKLSIYPGGIVPDGEIFVMSDYDGRSFDSRYFGSIPAKNIIGHIKEIWIFSIL